MNGFELERKTCLQLPLEEVFAFFSDPGNLEAITPPWLSFRIVGSAGPIEEGSTIDYLLRIRGLPLRWTSRISVWDPPHRFVDEQIRGPYRKWIHEHTFASEPGEDGSLTAMKDRVTYDMIGGRLVDRLFVRRDLERIFDHRAQRLHELLG